MFFLDGKNYPVNNTLDGADSAVRVGILYTGNHRIIRVSEGLKAIPSPINYVQEGGICVRHPLFNPWNFTRDQLDCLVAGLYATKNHYTVRKIFWAHFRRGFFAQNFERDVKGSTKYLWPHEFFKDSMPSPCTRLNKINLKEMKIERTLAAQYPYEEVESRIIDWADPVFGSIWHMIKAGKMWYFYWFAIIGIPVWASNVWMQSFAEIDSEQNQIYSQSFVNGKWALRLYRWLNPKWESQSLYYWEVRGEPEYHEIIKEVVTSA